MADDEAKPSPPAGGNQAVQLGIGTLIIIAIIVSMCSGGGEVKELRSDTRELKQQMSEINQKLDALLAKQATAPGANGAAPTPTPDTGTSLAPNR